MFQLVADAFWIIFAVVLAFRLRGMPNLSWMPMMLPALVFAVLMMSSLGALGTYRHDRKIGLVVYAIRVLLAMLVAVPVAYLTANVMPGGEAFKETASDWILIAFGGLVLVRQLVTVPVLKFVLPNRVLVLGTGPEARMVEASLATADLRRLQLVGFYPLDKIPETAVSPSRIIAKRGPLDETARALGIDEIIVAVREQRGGVLPLRGLLECRLAGVRITNMSRFFERVHGQIPIEALKASWLIYGSGFRQGWWRSAIKRTFDIIVALILVFLTLPIMVVTALIIAFESGSPIVYRQERVGMRGRTFKVLKFRSMRQDAEKDGQAVWATVGDSRVTAFGRFIRRSRIDELPQFINVLRGEMSFVGPRPERPAFVEILTEQIPFYAVRHSVKPGITGWAQVRYSYGANVEQSMRKLEYDLYYVKNHSLFLDIRILFETVRVVILGEGAR